MRIGTKLAVCLVCAAVVPLAAASAVFLHTSETIGRSVAAEGAKILTDRVTADMRRALESAAIALADQQDNSLEAVRLFASDVASRLATTPVQANGRPPATSDEFVLVTPGSPATNAIDLDKIAVYVAADAGRDQVAGTLAKLGGVVELARTLYFRNRSRASHFVVALDNGLSLVYPAGAIAELGDPRETPWYLRTLERGMAAWTGPETKMPSRLVAAAPVEFGDGRFAGVASVALRMDVLLSRALAPAHLSGEMSAYLFKVPVDDPLLLPHEVADLTPGTGKWRIESGLLPVVLDGDDAWLKTTSDIRSGVPGLETVRREGRREVWAFGPAVTTTDGELAFAVTSPAKVFEDVTADAEAFVDSAFDDQLRAAIGFAVVAAVLAALAGIFGARTLTRPIRRLHEAAQTLASGDFSVRIEAATRDELGLLARGFNRMVPALEERLKQERDLGIAREIQQHLVPGAAPSVGGFDIAGISEFSDETGGDYLDYIALKTGATAAVLGDATGHGVGSALLMATARAALRANALAYPDAATLIQETNRQLAGDSAGGRFVTLVLFVVQPDTDTIEWISAGQEPALIFDPAADTFDRLEGEGIPLGVDADWRFGAKTATLTEGRLLIAVTDGVREAKRADGTAYGGERLRAAVRAAAGRGSAMICQHVLDDLKAFLDGTPAGDDVSILVVRRAG